MEMARNEYTAVDSCTRKDRFKADLKHPDVTITEQDCKDKGIEWVTSRYWYLMLDKCVSCCLVLSCTRMYQVW
jgi:hypothetical protein